MLYINVYLVLQTYGGREEGGWYYVRGTPLASIPVDSDYKPGKSYYLSEGVKIEDCHSCSGTGWVDIEEGTECYQGRCSDCGQIPDSPEKVWEEIKKYQEFFKDEPGRYEDIRVSLEDHFAMAFPDKVPTYE